MQAFQNLDVWQKAHRLTLAIFKTTAGFPKEEAFGLSVALRRTSMNISMKIAEGCGKDDSVEFSRCLQHGRGTGVELQYLILLARDLEFIKPEVFGALQDQVVEVRKMLSGLMKAVVV